MAGISAADHAFNAFTETKQDKLGKSETRHCSEPSPSEIEAFRAIAHVTGFHDASITKEARKTIVPK